MFGSVKIISHSLQMGGWVNILDMHIIRNIDAGGGVVKDGFDAGLHEFICDFLRR